MKISETARRSVARTAPPPRRHPRIVAGAAALAVVALLSALAVGIAGFVPSHALQASPAQATAPPATAFPTLEPDRQVATVDGVAVPMRELQIFLAKDRAAILAHYQSNPSAGRGDAFWTRPVDGETPAARLTDAALADVARTTVQLELAAQHRLIADASYSTFLAAFGAENDRRRAAAANHQVVYGPVQYSEANYLDYLTGQYAYDLEPRLETDGTLPVTDAGVAAYFRANASQFASPDGTPADLTQPTVQSQVRRAFLDAQYQQLIQRLAQQAPVVSTDLDLIATSGCLTTGECTR